MCLLQHPCLCPVHEWRSYRCPVHLPLDLHVHFPVAQHFRHSLPVLHPTPTWIPGMAMSSLSLLSVPDNGSMRFNVHCAPNYSVVLLLIFNPRSSDALHHSSSFISTCSILGIRSTISSTNSIHQWGCSLMPRPITPIIISNR